MQRPDIRETFQGGLIVWSKAILNYCQATQMRCTAIKKIISEYDAEVDGKIHLTTVLCHVIYIKYFANVIYVDP